MSNEKWDIITVQEDEGEFFFKLEDILAGTTTRVSTVKYYEIEETDGGMVVTLYNKNKRKIKLKKKEINYGG